MLKNTKTIKNISIIVVLIALAVSWRIINHDYGIEPNLEIVTAATVLAAVTIGLRASIIVPVGSMIISDLFIGNSSIFVYTWSTFAIIGLLALSLKTLNNKPKLQILSSIGFAIGSSFLFFAVTNFGVWMQGWYPNTMAGLVECYTLAIPFYRTMLMGNLILVPTVIAAYQIVKSRDAVKALVVDTFVRK